MPIINEIDEKNPENNRNIDTDTGVYLKLTGWNGPERVYIYTIYDGESEINVYSNLWWDLDKSENINNVKNYLIDIDLLKGVHQKNFKIIENLLYKHGYDYRKREIISCKKQNVEIILTDNFVKKIQHWKVSDDK